MLEECPPDQRLVRLSAFAEMNAGKGSVLNESQRREDYLRQMNIYLMAACGPTNVATVDHWQVKLSREEAVDAGLESAGVNQSPDRGDSRNRGTFASGLEAWIKPDVHEDRRSMID